MSQVMYIFFMILILNTNECDKSETLIFNNDCTWVTYVLIACTVLLKCIYIHFICAKIRILLIR